MICHSLISANENLSRFMSCRFQLSDGWCHEWCLSPSIWDPPHSNNLIFKEISPPNSTFVFCALAFDICPHSGEHKHLWSLHIFFCQKQTLLCEFLVSYLLSSLQSKLTSNNWCDFSFYMHKRYIYIYIYIYICLPFV